MLITTLTICHTIISVLLILIVLIHFGKGAEAGLVLDTSSSSIIPQQGNFLNKVAVVLAVLFLSISLVLAILRGHENKSLFDKQPVTATTQQQASAPVLPATAPVAPATAPAPAPAQAAPTK